MTFECPLAGHYRQPGSCDEETSKIATWCSNIWYSTPNLQARQVRPGEGTKGRRIWIYDSAAGILS